MNDKDILSKVRRVIDSCINEKQLDVAENYAKLVIEKVFFHDKTARWGESFIRNYSRIIIRRLLSEKKAKLIEE